MQRAMKRAVTGVILALAVASCGDNWFTGPAKGTNGNAERPVVVALRVPDFVRPGGVLDVEVEATGTEGITTVDITLEETVVQERSFVIDPVRTSVTRATQFVLPDPLPRETVRVRAEVEDRLGGRSDPVVVDVPVLQDA